LRVREIPIRFVERRAGASKMTGAIVVEAIWKVPLLRLRARFGRL
jgi:dolichol-phosphate mannosyltransferase